MAWPNELAPAIFFDRDGTLMPDVDYCRDPAQVKIFPGAVEALRSLAARGYKILIITNQSGIGRGYFSEKEYHAVHRELLRQLGADLIAATYFCPDLPDANSERRKPKPGMVLEAQREHGLDLARSFFVGDKASDIACGRNAGTRTIFVQTGPRREQPDEGADFVARNLQEVAEIILRESE